jgi:hypothetical protein
MLLAFWIGVTLVTASMLAIPAAVIFVEVRHFIERR